MKIVLLKLVYFLLLLFVCHSFAQDIEVINTGDIYIGQNTEVAIVANFDNEDSGVFFNDGIVSFHHNFNNNGIISFLGDTGYTKFIGAKPQKISGSGTSEFYDVLFNNVGTDLAGKISVTGEVEFVKGIVNNVDSGGTFIFMQTGTHTHTSDASYVQGVVDNFGNQFEFPIGDGGFYRPETIQPVNKNAVNSDLYKGQYFYDSPYNNERLNPKQNKKDELIDFIDDKEYWEITKAVDLPNDVDLILTWNEKTTPSAIFTVKKGISMAIVRWDESQDKWVIEKGSEVNFFKKTIKVPLAPLVKEKVIFTLATVLKEPKDNIVFYNGISPDGDGKNDYFYISGMDQFPNNTLEIYNRWGTKVFGTVGYGINNNWFKGISAGKNVPMKGTKLPTGTYFYVLEYKTPAGKIKNRTGYLYIN